MGDEKELANDTIQVLHFYLQNIRLCIDINYIKQIIQLSRVESIPNSPPYLAGLMNFAGQSVPLIDLSIRLGLKKNISYALDTPVLLCSDLNKTTCLLIVDKIIGLSNIESESLHMFDKLNQPDSPFMAAVTIDTEVSLLINIQRVLAFNLTLGINEFKINNDLNLLNIAPQKHE